jgi:hypothetical protein
MMQIDKESSKKSPCLVDINKWCTKNVFPQKINCEVPYWMKIGNAHHLRFGKAAFWTVSFALSKSTWALAFWAIFGDKLENPGGKENQIKHFVFGGDHIKWERQPADLIVTVTQRVSKIVAQNYDSNRQVASGRVIWAASGPPPSLGAWAGAHMDGACSVIVALKSRTLRQHQKIFLLVVLMSKTFPPWAALFLSVALSLSLTHSEILPRPSYELQSADRWVDGCLLACLHNDQRQWPTRRRCTCSPAAHIQTQFPQQSRVNSMPEF